jgi:hypothetical protein
MKLRRYLDKRGIMKMVVTQEDTVITPPQAEPVAVEPEVISEETAPRSHHKNVVQFESEGDNQITFTPEKKKRGKK